MKLLGWLFVAVWAVLSVGSLVNFAAEWHRDHSGEIKELFAYELLTLNFPISSVVVFIAPQHPIAQWCLLTVAGFFQWTILAPWVFRLSRRIYARWSPREPSSDATPVSNGDSG